MKKIIAITAILLLTACASKPASQTIASHAIAQTDQLIDYAQHNLPATVENKLLITGLQNCRDGLENTTIACEAEKGALRDKIAYWKLIALAASALAGFLLFSKIKNLVKKWLNL